MARPARPGAYSGHVASADDIAEDAIQAQAVEATSDASPSAHLVARSGYSDEIDLECADVRGAGEESASWLTRSSSRGIGYFGHQDEAAAERDR